ncbi:hypothetical protein M2165_004913 [Variovorax sp. TBS-050B]|uniref:hypothetical protein n=1 Tax=Variovorax sp. TBS-050B TaxID=2940551 RepID=UPI0024772984|nr:hypothetical protein [Variovorax sp. TBS-050B]MDH6595024.1 hypothetical protein [Variovorax sp. TBS-050B]
MKAQQAKSDERDNRRVFRWGIGAAIVVFLLALLYNLLIQTREEGPVKPDTPTQSAPQVTPQSTPGGSASGTAGGNAPPDSGSGPTGSRPAEPSAGNATGR